MSFFLQAKLIEPTNWALDAHHVLCLLQLLYKVLEELKPKHAGRLGGNAVADAVRAQPLHFDRLPCLSPTSSPTQPTLHAAACDCSVCFFFVLARCVRSQLVALHPQYARYEVVVLKIFICLPL